MINLLNMDNMDLMAKYDDNYFDLAIVDPPYGIGMSGGNVGYDGNNHFERKEWDTHIPPNAYFNDLNRVSKNQIVWGGNYFACLWPTRGYIVWDKGPGFKGRTFAESELAYSSFDRNAMTFTFDPLSSGSYKGKIHPTQKPVKLYEWLLINYAKEGDKILDTHLGSGSIAIACHNYEYDLVGCEIDKEYYDQMMIRYNDHIKQQNLFIYND
jgi:site-specific DNA-methyltransferase (adenine-specific)